MYFVSVVCFILHFACLIDIVYSKLQNHRKLCIFIISCKYVQMEDPKTICTCQFPLASADKAAPHKMHREAGGSYICSANLDSAKQIQMSSVNFKICP